MPINLDELLNPPAAEPIIDTPPAEPTSDPNVDTTPTDVIPDVEPTGDHSDPPVDTTDDDTDDGETFIGSDGTQIKMTPGATPITDDGSGIAIKPDENDTPQAPALKDDFIKKAVDYYNTHGTLQPFLEATQVDYDKVDDLTLVRMKFEKDNPDLSPKVRERLLEKELQKYDLESLDDDEVEVGKELLRRDANKLRDSLKAEQSNFLNSIVPPAAVDQVNEQQLAAEREQNKLLAQQGIQGALNNNFIKIGQDADGVNFQVADPIKIAEYAVDPNQFLSTFKTPDGNIDWQKWVKVISFAENESLITSELVKRGKALGRKSVMAELKNSAPLPSANPEIPKTDGRVETPKDDPLYFLQNMKVVGKS